MGLEINIVDKSVVKSNFKLEDYSSWEELFEDIKNDLEIYGAELDD